MFAKEAFPVAAIGCTTVVYDGNNEWSYHPGGTHDVDGSTQNTLTNNAFSVTGHVQNTDDGAAGSDDSVFTGISDNTHTVSLEAIGKDSICASPDHRGPQPRLAGTLGPGRPGAAAPPSADHPRIPPSPSSREYGPGVFDSTQRLPALT